MIAETRHHGLEFLEMAHVDHVVQGLEMLSTRSRCHITVKGVGCKVQAHHRRIQDSFTNIRDGLIPFKVVVVLGRKDAHSLLHSADPLQQLVFVLELLEVLNLYKLCAFGILDELGGAGLLGYVLLQGGDCRLEARIVLRRFEV